MISEILHYTTRNEQVTEHMLRIRWKRGDGVEDQLVLGPGTAKEIGEGLAMFITLNMALDDVHSSDIS